MQKDFVTNDPDPSDCSCFGSSLPCARCGIKAEWEHDYVNDWLGTSMYPAAAGGEPERGPGDERTTVLDRPPALTPKKDEEPELPKQYQVWLLNDDYTPYDVVVEVIMEVFAFRRDEANRRMRGAHETGRALMGTFSKDVAETKAEQVSVVCRARYPNGGSHYPHPFPLRAVAEEAPGSGS